MESDLSLLEISGEDDSLLQQTPNEGVSIFNNNSLFSCSPLQIPRSMHAADPSHPLVSFTEGMTGNEGAEKPSSSAHRDSVNKENVNLNKPELLKLSLEPQQMKRKKKGGGYNLRKSLAWDRAFFTEEGVLDPVELSMISGNFSKPGGDGLSVIHEGRESLSGESISDSADLQALEGKLFKELPSSNEDRKAGGDLTPKHGSSAKDKVAPASKVKRKVLSAHDVNRSGSKQSGCPRPMASSSLKRPANVRTAKAAPRELKLSKISASKPDTSVHSTTAKSAIPTISKRNQIVQPFNVQKNIGLKASLSSNRSTQKDGKSGPAAKSLAAKSSVQLARRNVVSSASQAHLTTNLEHPVVIKANNGVAVVPDPELLTAAHAARVHAGGISKTSVSLPQNASYVGCNVQYTQLQTAKPSGLRMPSPSLGFFGQSKASALHGLPQRSSHQHNFPESSIPSFTKLGPLNPICERPAHAPGKMREVVSDVTTSGIKITCSGMGRSLPSTFNPTSHDKLMSNIQLKNMEKVDRSHGLINDQSQLQGFNCDDVDGEPCKTETISCVDKIELKNNDNKLLLQSGTCEQLKEDSDSKMAVNVCPTSTDLGGADIENPSSMSHLCLTVPVDKFSGTKDTIGSQDIGDKEPSSAVKNQYNSSSKNHDVFSESQYGDISCNSTEANEDQTELMKRGTYGIGLITNEETQSQKLEISKGTLIEESRSSNKFNQTNIPMIAGVSPKARELKRSHDPYHCKDIEHIKDAASEVCSSRKLHAEDTQVESRGGNLSLEGNNSILSTPAADILHSMVVDYVTENFGEAGHPNPCTARKQSFGHNDGVHLNDCFLHAESVYSEALQQENAVQGFKFNESERTNSCMSQLKSSGELSSISVMKDCVSDVAGMVDCIHAENAPSSCVVSEPVVETVRLDVVLQDKASSWELEKRSELKISGELGSIEPAMKDCVSDVAGMVDCIHVENATSGCVVSEPMVETVRLDVDVQDRSSSWELEKMNEDQIRGALTAGNIDSPYFYPDMELEVPYFTGHLEHMVNVKSASGTSDMVKHAGVEDKLSVKDHNAISDLVPGDEINCNRDTSTIHEELFSGMHGDEDTVCQAKLMMACVLNAGKTSEEKNLNPDVYDSMLFDESRCVEELSKLNDAGIANLSPNVKVSDGDVLKSPDNVPRQQHTEQENEVARVHDAVRKSLAVAPRQSLDGNLLTGSQDRNLSTLAANGKSPVVDDVNEQAGEHPELQNCGLVEQVSLGNNRMCLDIGLLLANNNSSEELQERDALNSVSELREACGNDSKRYNVCTQSALSSQGDRVNVDNTAENLPLDDLMSDSSDINPSFVENKYSVGTAFCHEDKLGGRDTSLEVDLSPKINKDQILGDASAGDSESFCCLDDESRLLVKVNQICSCVSVVQGTEVTLLQNNISLEQGETNIHESSGSPKSEIKLELDNAMSSTEDKDITAALKRPENCKKQDDLVVKHPPNAAPFSDEWLAAIEAAGEDILTKKTGSVQNSPPDKSQPEPGPWSPVKRKNNQGIGPFDCTKYTNTQITPNSN